MGDAEVLAATPGGLPSPADLAKALVAELEKAPARFPSGSVVTDMSSLLSSLSGPTAGPAGAATLPRDTGAFAPLPFSPGQPLLPAPIGPRRPGGDGGRPDIRRYEYPVGWNLTLQGQPILPFKVLRDSAEYVDLIRRCIEVRKSEITRLTWDITFHPHVLAAAITEAAATAPPRNPTSTTLATQVQARVEAQQKLITTHQADIKKARLFWETPDRLNNLSFAEWLSAALEEYFVLDALSIYPHPDMSGALHSLEVIDGSTIKPLLDARGATPQPPAPAYQQVLYGFPRSEWTASPDGAIAGAYSSDELIYRPRHRRAFTPYGHSPVEKALNSADLWLKRQEWIRTEYTEGSIPTMFIKVPETVTWSAEQLRQYEAITNELLAGQTAERLRLRFLPPGLVPHTLDRFTDMYKPDYDFFLVKLVCMHFDVMPTELGFVPSRGLGGKGHQEGEEASEYRKGILPMAEWLQDVLSDISRRYLDISPDLIFKFSGLETQDEKLQAEIDQMQILNGISTIDEIRAKRGLPLFGLKLTNAPLLVAGGIMNNLSEDPDAAPKPPPGFPPDGAGPGPAGPGGGGRPPGGAGPSPGGPAPDPAVTKELATFARIAAKVARADPGRPWADFSFIYTSPELAEALNKAARDKDWSTITKLVGQGSAGDRLRTVAHHADSLAFNYAHARKHMDEAFDTTGKMLAHIEANPDLIDISQEMKELEQRRPEVAE